MPPPANPFELVGMISEEEEGQNIDETDDFLDFDGQVIEPDHVNEDDFLISDDDNDINIDMEELDDEGVVSNDFSFHQPPEDDTNDEVRSVTDGEESPITCEEPPVEDHIHDQLEENTVETTNRNQNDMSGRPRRLNAGTCVSRLDMSFGGKKYESIRGK